MLVLNIKYSIELEELLHEDNIKGAMLAVGANSPEALIQRVLEDVALNINNVAKRYPFLNLITAEMEYEGDSTRQDKEVGYHEEPVRGQDMYLNSLEQTLPPEQQPNYDYANYDYINYNDGNEAIYDDYEEIDNDQLELFTEYQEKQPTSNTTPQEKELKQYVLDKMFSIRSTLGFVESIVVPSKPVKEFLVDEITELNDDNVIVRLDSPYEVVIRYKDINNQIQEEIKEY